MDETALAGHPHAMVTVSVEGVDCELAHNFGGGRAIVRKDGELRIVDRFDAHTWAVSSEPPRDNERQVLNSLSVPATTTFLGNGGSVLR